MRSEHEALMVVRAELCDRLEALRRFSAKRKPQDFTESVIGIRRLAAAYGLSPVVRLSEAFERAMTRPDTAGPCQRSLYLDRLHDAIDCERLDDQASEAMIASWHMRPASPEGPWRHGLHLADRRLHHQRRLLLPPGIRRQDAVPRRRPRRQLRLFLLAAAGASAGVIAANVPAMALAERMPKSMPLKQIRTGIALLFLAGALIVGVNALRLA